ncbi:MAG: rod shape-determining protein MreD [Ferrovum sp.]|nr:rod shape-determining protein MreD [Ferrovum sp.]
MLGITQEPQILKRPATVRKVTLSFLLAFLLMLLPWSGPWLLLRPDFMVLLLVYWTVREPMLIGGWIAFSLGIVADVADSSTLGIHALGYSIVYFLAMHYRTRILSFYAANQALHILPILFASQLVTALAALVLKFPLPGWLWWFQTPFTALFWIALPALLERQQDHDEHTRGS